MATLREFTTKWGFDVDTSQIKKIDGVLTKTQKNLRATADLAVNAGKKLSLGLTLPIAGLVGLAGKAAADMEASATQFEVLTGSAEKAADLMKELQGFSAKTPFQFKDIAKAGQQLLGFQVPAEEIQENLRRIGDVAAAAGSPLKEVSLIFGQVKAAGKLTGERLLQFQERAIPIGPALAETMGVAESSIKDLVSAGKVDFATFEKAFNSMSEEGGKAFGGMSKLSETLKGRISTLKDNIALLLAQFGEDLLPVFKSVLESTLSVVQMFRGMGKATRTTILVLAGLAAAIGPLLILFGTMVKSIFAIRLALRFMRIEGLKTFGILLLKVLAVVAFLALLGLVMDDLAAFFRGEDSFTGVLVNEMDRVLKSFQKNFPLMSKAVLGFVTLVSTPLRAVVGSVRALAAFAGALFGGASFKEAFTLAAGEAKAAVIDPFKDVAAGTVSLEGLTGTKGVRTQSVPAPAAAKAPAGPTSITNNMSFAVPEGTDPNQVAPAIIEWMERQPDEIVRQSKGVGVK